MSLDRSLKAASALVRHRNVLTRAERLERLADEEKWNDKKSVFGLPKVANRKLEVGKGTKDDAAAGDAAAPAAGAAAGAGKTAAGAQPGAKGAAAPAAGAKAGAAPAAGGKGAAAPAAKGGKK